MAYLAASIIQRAVKRLGDSRADRGFVDFLLVKRGMSRSHSDTLAMGLRSEHLVAATHELMACDPPGSTSTRMNPFINVFGTGSHNDHGYRSAKYCSNGTSVTAPRWRAVFELVGSRPAVLRLTSDYLQHLPKHTLTQVGKPLPYILDAARWFHRFTELESFGISTGETSDTELVASFTEAISLTEDEIALLFSTQPPPEDDKDAQRQSGIGTGQVSDFSEQRAAQDSYHPKMKLRTPLSQPTLHPR